MLTNLFTTQTRVLATLEEEAFENIVGKGENAGNKHFLLFPQCFLLYHFLLHLVYRLQMLSILRCLNFFV